MGKKELIGCLVALMAVFFCAFPAFAGKKVLSEEEMEAVTAAGEPTVIVASGFSGATATLSDEAVFNLNIPTDAQQGLRALTVQNVVGEVQLLVNLNILSASKSVAATDQRNFSVQSWGSTLPNFLPGPSSEPGVPGIDLGACVTTCIKSSIGTVGVAAPGVIGSTPSASGDVIVDVSSSNGTATAVDDQQPVFNLTLDAHAQTSLTALFIANIVGRAQTAFNINIAAATLNLIPDAGQPFATPFETAGPGTIKQINSGVQFRGTPLGTGNTAATVTVLHTPN